MGNGMNKVLPGLYVGNYRDSKDQQQLDKYKITHIVAIHDCPRRLLPDKHYLCIMATDTPDQNLSQYFAVCNDFIHAARLRDGNVLIHCLAGMSRSVTVTVAYIMSVTHLSWREALKVVRTGRSVANPNNGFQIQLQEFEQYKLAEERRRLKERFPTLAMETSDKQQCTVALSSYEQLLSNNDICEGLCNADTRTGIFRKKMNTSRSRLSLNQSTSCPTSPRHGLRSHSTTSSLQQLNECSMQSSSMMGLHRSASTISALRTRNSPSGLHAYTDGSAPPSVNASRVDLSTACDKGSAIYLGCSPPRPSPSFSGTPVPPSTGAINKMPSTSSSTISLSGRSKKSQRNTPPASPRKSLKSCKTTTTTAATSTPSAPTATNRPSTVGAKASKPPTSDTKSTATLAKTSKK